MASRLFALLVWAAVAASLAYWGLRWLSKPISVPPNATPVSMESGSQGDLRRLLIGPAKASGPAQSDTSQGSALAARLKLLGVVAPKHEDDGSGVALLSIDGKPPKAIRVGDVIDGEMVLKSLTQRGAAIGPADGPVAANLDLPLLPAPTTGSLPPPQGVTMSGATAQQVPSTQATPYAPPAPPAGMAPGTPPTGMRPMSHRPPSSLMNNSPT